MSDTAFELHPQLATDCYVLGSLGLSLLLMMNDTQYPWFILVPQRASLTELHQLTAADSALFWQESKEFSRQIMQSFNGDKLNVAALGNVVPQLHVHHIVRFKTDAAWPRPVWGASAACKLTADQLQQRVTLLKSALTAVQWRNF